MRNGLGFLTALPLAVLCVGCTAAEPRAPLANPVTARLTGAEVYGGLRAPKVSKTQHSDPTVASRESIGVEPKRVVREKLRPSNGFSGYK